MSEGSGEFTIQCGVCMRSLPVEHMVQIVPCLHLFCSECIAKSEQAMSQKEIRKKKKSGKHVTRRLELTCLAKHCYSPVRRTSSQQAHLLLNNCDYELCPRKLSIFESARAASCTHELCSGCLDDALASRSLECPVEGCKELLAEGDVPDVCAECKKPLVNMKYITTQCCKSFYCKNCAEKRFNMGTGKDTNGSFVCPEGKCQVKKKVKKHTSVSISSCSGEEGCMGTALNGFPSSGECEHEVCLQCLEKMIEECQASGTTPCCPNALCRQPYNVDSVIALKALLPQKAEYFSGLALENQGYDAIKDDSVTISDISPDFSIKSRRMVVKLEVEGGEEADLTVTYDKKGNVADFIREVRRTLKILPFDKVYGYYIRREGSGKTPDEELLVDSHSLTRPISELQLTPGCAFVVDLSGIVQPKSSPTKK